MLVTAKLLDHDVADIPNLRSHGERQATDHEEEQANALLIAAAPDLLEALETVLLFTPHAEHAWDSAKKYQLLFTLWKCRQAAERAIAKAKGQS